MMYLTYNETVDGHEGEQSALNYARSMVWSEAETSERSIAHGRHIDTINGVGVYYDYGADYYFFTDDLTANKLAALSSAGYTLIGEPDADELDLMVAALECSPFEPMTFEQELTMAEYVEGWTDQ